MDKPLILASASPRRREILTLAGIPFETHPADDEFAPAGLSPRERVRALAQSKARQVVPLYSGRVILGADTMVAIGDRVLGKPHSEAEALEMLMALQGKEHTVLTGVWLIRTDSSGSIIKEDGFTDETAVRFFPMTEADARAYIATGEPMDKAGAYGIQGYGMRFVEGIRGDFFTVMGLPGGRLIRFLRDFSADLPSKR